MDVSNSSLGGALRLAYPQLGLTAIAQVIAQIPEEAENICQTYDLRWSERLSQVLKMIGCTPVEFQKWINEKKFSPRDLFPLLAVRDLSEFEPVLSHLARSSLTRSLASQALEWSVELFLMGVPFSTILGNKKDWWASLRKLRRPIESAQTERREKFLREAPLPSHTAGQWLNASDQPALEIKLQASSAKELHQLLDKLKSVSDAWEKLESST